MSFLSSLLIYFITSACFDNPAWGYSASITQINHTVSDTVFLRKLVFDTVYEGKPYHIFNNIYIDSNRNSVNHQSLANFSFTESQNLDAYNERIIKRKIQLNKINTLGLPTEWVPLYQYKNKYYVYMPSEQGELRRRIINDSLLIFWFMDGPMPYILQSITKSDNETWLVKSKDQFVRMEGFIRPEILNIHIIDPVYKIAVWEYKSENDKEYRYELCIPKESIPHFDIIVNDSNEKAMEFEFENPDFKKLLKKKTVK
ncbi:MAG: hypothetical protein ABI581_02195 [Sediminibacterium sp.]